MASFAAKLEGLPAFPGSEPVEVPWFKQVEMKLGSTDDIGKPWKWVTSGTWEPYFFWGA